MVSGAEVPAHVYSLAEHVELGRAGWWPDAIDRTILHSLFVQPGGLSEKEVVRGTVALLSCPEDRPLISDRIVALCRSGDIALDRDRLVLSEDKRTELDDELVRSRALDGAVRQHFASVASAVGEHSVSWEQFEAEVLTPIVAELGARTVDLLTGRVELAVSRSYRDFVEAREDPARAESLCVRFLDPEVAHIRQYMMGRLNYYFLVASGHVTRSILESLRPEEGEPRPAFNLVLDTNTIFSLMQLHANPANEATRALIDLRARVSEFVDVEMFVLPETLAEARLALKNALSDSPTTTLTPNLVQGAEDSRELSGLVGRYIQVASARPQTAATYFGTYIDNLETMLEGLGITILQVDLSTVREKRSFQQSVSDRLSHEEGARKPRTRGAIEHDFLAMEYVQSRRPVVVKNVAQAGWWFLTVDIVLQRREREAYRGRKGIPRAVMPDELSQVLRFWVPRSEAMERALMGGVRLPFSFFAYDNRSQAVSIAILDVLARFDDVEHMTPETVTNILADGAVRRVFERDDATDDERITKVEAAVVNKAVELEAQLALRERETAELRAALADVEAKVTSRRAVEGGQAASKKKILDDLERANREKRKATSDLAAQRAAVQRLQSQLDVAVPELERLTALQRQQARSRAVLGALVLGLAAGIGTWALMRWAVPQLADWAVAAGAFIAVVVGAATLAPVSRALGEAEWPLASFLQRHATAVRLWLASVIASIVAAIVYEAAQ